MSNNAPARVFDRVLIIMFENMYRSYVMQNAYMAGLAKQGIDMANYHGVMHPSQTNYISSIAGELCNVSSDDRPPPLPQKTIVDLVEAGNLTWKAYMDGYDPVASPWTPNMVPEDQFPYLIKHNPFSSFANILGNPDRWKKIVSAHQLYEDAASKSLPEYAWFTPDMWNDGHYIAGTKDGPKDANGNPLPRAPALVDQQAVWLKYLFGMLKFPGPDSVLQEGTLVVVTYDEADFEAEFDIGDKYTYDGPNQIYTVLLGSMVDSVVKSDSESAVQHEAYNHYSLIRTIEQNFDLGTLGKNDRHSNWFQFLWGRRFRWGKPQKTSIATSGPIALACHQAVLTLAFRDAHGRLCATRYLDDRWTEPDIFGDLGEGSFALAVADETLYLVYASGNGIEQRTYDGLEWSATSPVIDCGPVGSLDLAAFNEEQQLMLSWSDAAGRLFSLTCSDGAWDTESVGIGGATPFVTGGPVSLAVLGSSIFCIYKAANVDTLMVVSYNCADFNVITAGVSTYSGPYNNTTKDRWSPSAFPVEQFASKPSPKTSGEREPKTVEFAGCTAPLACATLDGVIHLTHTTRNGNQIVSETMSLSGMLTAKLPVTYDDAPKVAKTTSNGYGTLAQAGWTKQFAIKGTELGPQQALSMCCDGQRLWLAYAEPLGNITVSSGDYTPPSNHVP